VPSSFEEASASQEALDDQPSPHARTRFGALAYREFRLLWFGLLVSNTGGWMAILAQGWLVVQLAPNASLASLYLGLVGFARAIPVFALSGVAGALADRQDRRRILAVCELLLGLLTLLLGILAQTGVVRVWQVLLIAALSAATSAFEAPTRQSLVSVLVGKRELMNAIGLNSAAFNGPAIIGPALGGLIVNAYGVADCFYINAASYMAVYAAVLLLKPKPPLSGLPETDIWSDVIEGFRYVRANSLIFAVVVLSALQALIGRPYIQLLPAFSKAQLGAGARELGILLAVSGAGALVGSIATAFIGGRAPRGRLLIGSAAASGALLALLGATHSLLPAATVLLALGVAAMLFLGTANTILQTHTPIAMRGRVMSIYTMIFLGFMPLGSWLLGSIASVTSLPVAFVLGGVVLIAAVAITARRPDIRALT
jgi:MFS family permease